MSNHLILSEATPCANPKCDNERKDMEHFFHVVFKKSVSIPEMEQFVEQTGFGEGSHVCGPCMKGLTDKQKKLVNFETVLDIRQSLYADAPETVDANKCFVCRAEKRKGKTGKFGKVKGTVIETGLPISRNGVCGRHLPRVKAALLEVKSDEQILQQAMLAHEGTFTPFKTNDENRGDELCFCRAPAVSHFSTFGPSIPFHFRKKFLQWKENSEGKWEVVKEEVDGKEVEVWETDIRGAHLCAAHREMAPGGTYGGASKEEVVEAIEANAKEYNKMTPEQKAASCCTCNRAHRGNAWTAKEGEFVSADGTDHAGKAFCAHCQQKLLKSFGSFKGWMSSVVKLSGKLVHQARKVVKKVATVATPRQRTVLNAKSALDAPPSVVRGGRRSKSATPSGSDMFGDDDE